MPDFLILREDPDTHAWAVTQIVHNVNARSVEAAVRQGFVGEGHYAAMRWDQRVEFDMTLGQVDARPRR